MGLSGSSRKRVGTSGRPLGIIVSTRFVLMARPAPFLLVSEFCCLIYGSHASFPLPPIASSAPALTLTLTNSAHLWRLALPLLGGAVAAPCWGCGCLGRGGVGVRPSTSTGKTYMQVGGDSPLLFSFLPYPDRDPMGSLARVKGGALVVRPLPLQGL